MKLLFSIFSLLLFLLFATLAQAQTQTATFTLTWVDNSTTELGFKIERASLPAGPFGILATVGANIVTYADVITGDSGNRQYCYRLLAYNSAGNSAYSNVACATTPVIVVPPNAPTAMTIFGFGIAL